jgi:hypothetical protein
VRQLDPGQCGSRSWPGCPGAGDYRRDPQPLLIERNFFGVVRVTDDPAGNVHRLFHGSTLHGQQSLDPALSHEPSTYFTRSGPIGSVFAALRPRLDQPGTRVAIVGLGAGTLACYAGPGQRWTFYEIDPAVERIARDPRFFTICETPGGRLVVLGDARPGEASITPIISSSSMPSAPDAPPMHPVSREAIRPIKLAEGGVLAFNLSDRWSGPRPGDGPAGRTPPVAGSATYDHLVTRRQPASSRSGPTAEPARPRGPTSNPLGGCPSCVRNAPVWTDDYPTSPATSGRGRGETRSAPRGRAWDQAEQAVRHAESAGQRVIPAQSREERRGASPRVHRLVGFIKLVGSSLLPNHQSPAHAASDGPGPSDCDNWPGGRTGEFDPVRAGRYRPGQCVAVVPIGYGNGARRGRPRLVGARADLIVRLTPRAPLPPTFGLP